MPFRDRVDAGRRLATALEKYRDCDAVVLALPRGGVPVAAEVAHALSAPLDLILVRKIGVPFQPELAMGAVADGGEPLIVRNEDVIALGEIDATDFRAACERELAEIERRRTVYLGDRPRPHLRGRVAIVVDDGVATGATVRAALRAVRKRKPKTLVVAVPVAPTSAMKLLRAKADDVICLEHYEEFGAIGAFYTDFRQLTDDDVIGFLKEFSSEAPARSRQ